MKVFVVLVCAEKENGENSLGDLRLGFIEQEGDDRCEAEIEYVFGKLKEAVDGS